MQTRSHDDGGAGVSVVSVVTIVDDVAQQWRSSNCPLRTVELDQTDSRQFRQVDVIELCTELLSRWQRVLPGPRFVLAESLGELLQRYRLRPVGEECCDRDSTGALQ